MKKKAVYRVPVPLDGIEAIQADMSSAYSKYGSIFSDREEFDLFWMLPLSDDQRLVLINRMLKEKKTSIEVENCVGVKCSSDEHRRSCLECVTTSRPRCAIPYYK
jgi:hypothetical protein